ncbi:monocarboxylate transporter 2-like [Anguilla anguilla]|uniref:monocarboxylate transporter 2-like n=1 Tax=Anguilla anguilla TaxID=7936 RepID=UPI0015A85FB8|nr:monocarboxylate transporter 2-like [Anguilla anguilla]XP_035239457.1 monocarboxylate transporter 2-like [Anguilla anguilla]
MPATTTSLGYTPPDGGWGWAVVFGSFICIGFSYAFPKALTIYFKEIQEFFSISYSEIAWVSSIMLATMYAGGPVSSILVNRYGSRPVVIAGGLMCGVAMVTASFGNSIMHLYICIGIIGGMGLAFNLQPALTIIGKYFLVKRPIANGLAMAGSPVLLSTLAPLNQFLLDSFGWRGAFFILGAIILNSCAAGALMRPIGPKPPRNPENPSGNGAGKASVEDGGGKASMEDGGGKASMKDGGGKASPEDGGGKASPEDGGGSQDVGLLSGQGPRKRTGCADGVCKLIDLSLFRHRGFLIYLVGNVIMFFGFFAPIVFLAPYAKHMGIDEYQAAFLLSILALVDMFARPATGMVANSRWVRPRIQYFFSLSVAYNGVCHLLCPLATGYAGLVVYAVFFGVAFGMVCALLFEVLMDLVGAQRFSSAVGLVTIIECGPVLLGPPIAGALVDIFMDYKYMYYACGVMMLAAGIFLFVMNFYNYRRLEQEEKERLAAAVEVRAGNEESTVNGTGEKKSVEEEVPAPEDKGEPACTFETET